jgi:hypothetical protein
VQANPLTYFPLGSEREFCGPITRRDIRRTEALPKGGRHADELLQFGDCLPLDDGDRVEPRPQDGNDGFDRSQVKHLLGKLNAFESWLVGCDHGRSL